MRPIFHSELVNGDSGDPALFVDMQYMGRALLVDLGGMAALAPRKMLRVDAVFVSHTHMDHFICFDRLLRVLVGRDRRISLFGPPGFADQVESKLSAYTWNLVDHYDSELAFMVSELHPDGQCEKWAFSSKKGFARESLGRAAIPDGILMDERMLRVRCAFLDHAIPCLAFAIEEKMHANIWKNRLQLLGLEPGPWLRVLRESVLSCAPDDTKIDAGGREMTLSQLWSAVRIVPGQKTAM